MEAEADVQRIAPSSLMRGLLTAACVALAGGQARAQSAIINPYPLAPEFESNPLKPPRSLTPYWS